MEKWEGEGRGSGTPTFWEKVANLVWPDEGVALKGLNYVVFYLYFCLVV